MVSGGRKSAAEADNTYRWFICPSTHAPATFVQYNVTLVALFPRMTKITTGLGPDSPAPFFSKLSRSFF